MKRGTIRAFRYTDKEGYVCFRSEMEIHTPVEAPKPDPSATGDKSGRPLVGS